MTQAIYNLRCDGDNFRITKFIDGNPEASYLLSHSECECPSGHRPLCRHRTMLPAMLARHLLDSGLFWNHDLGFSCNILGQPERNTVVIPAGPESDTSPARDEYLDGITKRWPEVASQSLVSELLNLPQYHGVSIRVLEGEILPASKHTQTPLPSAHWRRL